jgi:hypothetical protein
MNSLTNIFTGAVGSAFEHGNDFSVLVSGSNIVETDLIASMYLFGLYSEHIAGMCGIYEADMHIERNTDPAMGVAGKCKCTIGGGEYNATVHNAMPIEHFIPNGVMQPAVTFTIFIYLEAHPFSEVVFGEHCFENFLRHKKGVYLRNRFSLTKQHYCT